MDPIVTEDEILACQIKSWYHLFIKNTIKTIIIDLPEEFVIYLKSDGIVLPTCVSNVYGDDHISDDEDDDPIWDNSELIKAPNFQILTNQIKESIKALNGEVFVKLNWSAPSDASWMQGGSLKCTNVADIYILLKSSDRIMFDIEHMFNLCPSKSSLDLTIDNINNSEISFTSYVCNSLLGSSDQSSEHIDKIKDIENSRNNSNRNNSNRNNSNIIKKTRPDIFNLVIRKWANLNPSMEFRLFICKKQLVGISQRDATSYFEFLIEEKDELEDLLSDFYEDKIQNIFPLDSYSVDLFVDKKKRIWIIDFNPFGEPTNSLLFEWSELLGFALGNKSDNKNNFISKYDNLMRIVEKRQDCQPSEIGYSRGPIDVALAPDFHQFMKICKSQKANNDSDSD